MSILHFFSTAGFEDRDADLVPSLEFEGGLDLPEGGRTFADAFSEATRRARPDETFDLLDTGKSDRGQTPVDVALALSGKTFARDDVSLRAAFLDTSSSAVTFATPAQAQPTYTSSAQIEIADFVAADEAGGMVLSDGPPILRAMEGCDCARREAEAEAKTANAIEGLTEQDLDGSEIGGLVGSIGLGGFTNSELSVIGEQDEYTLSVVSGNTYSVNMFANGSGIGPGSTLDTFLMVFSDAALTNLIASDDDAGDNTNSYLTFTAAATGTYYVQARAFNNQSSGTYSLIVEDVTVDTPRDSLDWGSSFYDSTISIYFAGSGETYDGKSSLGWTTQQINDTMDALQEMVGDITLTASRTFNAASANMVLVTYNQNDNSSGYFNPPGFGDSAGVGAWNLFSSSFLSDSSWDAGTGAYHTLLHEFGHGLGLAHAHDSGGTSNVMDGVTSNTGDYGTYGLNQGAYTIMGYNYRGDINGDAAGGTATDPTYGFALGPSALDLGILQSRYGADMTVNTGDNTYVVDDTNDAGSGFETIWDAGGSDFIVYFGTKDVTIDLRAATLLDEVGGGGFLSNADGIFAGFTIANGVVIENAQGSSGNDIVNGNAANNLLFGVAGNDTVTAGGGNDTLVGGTGIDQLFGGDGSDRFEDNSTDNGVGEVISGGDTGSNIDTIAVFSSAVNQTVNYRDDTVTGIERIAFGSSRQADLQINMSADQTTDLTSIVSQGSDVALNEVFRVYLDTATAADLSGVTATGFTQGVDNFVYIGDADGESMSGTNFGEIFFGNGGTDVLIGNSGDDSLYGGTGSDTIEGGDDNDLVSGGADDDALKGGGGSDSIQGGAGNDILYDNASLFGASGSVGNDTLTGGLGNDSIYVNDGNDVVDLSDGGSDVLNIYADTAGSITLTGAGTDDLVSFAESTVAISNVGSTFTGAAMSVDIGNVVTVVGGSGNDTITEGSLNDIALGDGDDRFIGSANGGFNTIDGGDGNDTYESVLNYNTVNLQTGVVNGVAGVLINFENFEKATLGGNDNITAADTGSSISTGAGADTLIGAAGDDTLIGLAGNDSIQGGNGNDSVDGGADNDTMTGGNGDDTMQGGAGDDSIQGGDGTDSIEGGAGNDYIVGGQTFDETLRGGDGNDTVQVLGGGEITGDDGDDLFTVLDANVIGLFGPGTASVDGGIGNDTFDASNELTEAFDIDLAGGTITDAVGTTVIVSGVENAVGTNQNDTISGQDVTGGMLDGSGGNDSITGGLLNDTLLGGADNDTLDGGAGDDVLNGGDGDDTVFANAGNDTVELGDGGADLLNIDGDTALTIVVNGGSFNDTVSFSETTAAISNSGSVFSGGTMSADIGDFIRDVTTGQGNDTISEETLDRINLNGGNDRFIGNINVNIDEVDGGTGTDTYVRDATTGQTINLQTGEVDGVAGALLNFENFSGNSSGGNETVTAVDTGSLISSGAGDDSLIGSLGNDTLLGGTGSDDLAGNDGNDSLTGGSQNDTLRGNEGQDTLLGQGNADQLYGGQNEDSVSGGAGFDLVDGGDGDDTVDGGSGNDTVRGGDGNDTVNGVAGSDFIEGGSGNDSILGGNGFDTIDGGIGADTIDGGLGLDLINAGGANDSVLGNAGSDTINGDGGNDTLEGQGGNDLIDGGGGSDSLTGGVNNDTLTGGFGNDTLQGDLGADDFVFQDSNGADVVNDFLINVDDLDFSAVSSINSFADFQAAASDVGFDLLIALGGSNQITLLGVQESQVDAGDLIF